MSSTTPVEAGRKSSLRGFCLVALLLVSVLVVLFHESFVPGKIIFSNDGPLGAISSAAARLPSGFQGSWLDLNWLGNESVSAAPSFSAAIATALKPVGYAKFFAPIAFLLLGLSAWALCRQLKLAPIACVLAGLAATLNSDFFSTGCWGVVAQPVCFAAGYLALAAVTNSSSSRHPWARMMLAGLCVGLGVMEGFDIGAIFSLFVAAYVLFQSWNTEDPLPPARKLTRGFLCLAIVAAFAGFIAVQTLESLVGTQIKGVAGTTQDEQTKQQQWGFATQWSVPKKEVLQVVFPGIFGYRLDTANGGNYWGSIGQDPNVPELVKALSSPDENARNQAAGILNNPRNAGIWRNTGSGLYAGVLVVVIAFWGVLQSFRRKGSPFSNVQRRSIWFWLAVALIGLLMGFGKYAPFYQFFYSLPYASTIRNPYKFMHVFQWALVMLFAYGLHGLCKGYLQNSVTRVQGIRAQFKAWWGKAAAFDKKWLTACALTLAATLIGWMMYASSASSLQAHLQQTGFDAAMAQSIAGFSLRSVGWFLLFFTLILGLLGLIMSGQFAGPRAKWAGVLLGTVLLVDLGRANLPWIVYWDVGYKYANNPIIDLLKSQPYEHRVTMMPYGSSSQQLGLLRQVYGIEWVQHLFQYYNIQSLDVIQEPRVPVDKKMFLDAVPNDPNAPRTLLRNWELTNTRYLLGQGGGFIDALNQQIDPGSNRFRLVESFNLAPKPGTPGTSLTDYAAMPDPKGELAVIEFTGALSRAQLYSNWQVNTNDEETLKTLASPSFNPQQTVLVSNSISAPAAGATNQPAGTVRIKPNYEPKRVELDADVKAPSVLLLNDKFGPKWQVLVDGKPQPLLRCNFIMRGVRLEPGHHDVVFQFVTSQNTLYVSLAAVLLGLGLCAWLLVDKPGAERPGAAKPAASPAVADNQKPAKS
ncbi:MAG: hypothetical protein JWR69_604 [Pedosphaera sp.]|nr:hypothetical protein [Pedosphaera sp.]